MSLTLVSMATLNAHIRLIIQLKLLQCVWPFIYLCINEYLWRNGFTCILAIKPQTQGSTGIALWFMNTRGHQFREMWLKWTRTCWPHFQDWCFSNSFKTALKKFITSVEEQEEHQGISCHICACHMLVASRQGAALHRSCLARGSAQESDKRTRGNKCN